MLTNLRIAITLVSALPLVAATGIFDDCPSRQSGTLGHATTIKCSIGSNFSSVYWYRSNDTLLVRYEVENRSEHLLENDEYGIESDGSLRINNVSSHHRTVYRVIVYDDENHTYKKSIRFRVDRPLKCYEGDHLERLTRRREQPERIKQRERLERKRKRLMQLQKKEKREKQKQKRRQEKLRREETRTRKQER